MQEERVLHPSSQPRATQIDVSQIRQGYVSEEIDSSNCIPAIDMLLFPECLHSTGGHPKLKTDQFANIRDSSHASDCSACHALYLEITVLQWSLCLWLWYWSACTIFRWIEMNMQKGCDRTASRTVVLLSLSLFSHYEKSFHRKWTIYSLSAIGAISWCRLTAKMINVMATILCFCDKTWYCRTEHYNLSVECANFTNFPTSEILAKVLSIRNLMPLWCKLCVQRMRDLWRGCPTWQATVLPLVYTRRLTIMTGWSSCLNWKWRADSSVDTLEFS